MYPFVVCIFSLNSVIFMTDFERSCVAGVYSIISSEYVSVSIDYLVIQLSDLVGQRVLIQVVASLFKFWVDMHSKLQLFVFHSFHQLCGIVMWQHSNRLKSSLAWMRWQVLSVSISFSFGHCSLASFTLDELIYRYKAFFSH